MCYVGAYLHPSTRATLVKLVTARKKFGYRTSFWFGNQVVRANEGEIVILCTHEVKCHVTQTMEPYSATSVFVLQSIRLGRVTFSAVLTVPSRHCTSVQVMSLFSKALSQNLSWQTVQCARFISWCIHRCLQKLLAFLVACPRQLRKWQM